MRNLLIGSIACVSLLIVGCGPTGGVDEEAGPSPEIGVTDTEILFGTHTDLTGPIALYGVESVNGVQMRFDEVNAAGGVHGRQRDPFAECGEQATQSGQNFCHALSARYAKQQCGTDSTTASRSAKSLPTHRLHSNGRATSSIEVHSTRRLLH